MIILFYILLFLFLALGAILLILYLVMMFDSIIFGHDLKTSKYATETLVKIINKYKPNAKNFYDLGCARGDLSLSIKRKFPNLQLYGIDNSLIRIIIARLKAIILRQKINFIKRDIFNIDLKNADVVYPYLWYTLMPRLEQKLLRELKKGAVVITNTTKFTKWKPVKKIVICPKNSKIPDFETILIYIKK